MSALTDVFTAIANAIRSKKGVSTTYKPSEMASAINSISTGTDTSDATLDSGSRMLSGYTAYAKGTKYTGSIVTRSPYQTMYIGGSDTNPIITFDPGYYSYSHSVRSQSMIKTYISYASQEAFTLKLPAPNSTLYYAVLIFSSANNAAATRVAYYNRYFSATQQRIFSGSSVTTKNIDDSFTGCGLQGISSLSDGINLDISYNSSLGNIVILAYVIPN